MTLVARDYSAEWRRRKANVVANVKARRLGLIAKLGGACVDCGETDPEKLEFDHKSDRTWVCRELARWSRIARYEAEAERDEIELRCGTCNKRKGRPNDGEPDAAFVADGERDF